MKLNFIYSIEYEKERVNYYIKNKKKYRNYNILMPENDIIFNINEYKKREKEIKKDFNYKIKKIKLSFLLKEYNIILTKYGTGGSYRLPNTIILNLVYKNTFKIILHEMLHLWLEKRIGTLDSSEKELIIDSLCTYILKK